LLSLGAWVDAADCPRRFRFRRLGQEVPEEATHNVASALRAAFSSPGPAPSGLVAQWLETASGQAVRRFWPQGVQTQVAFQISFGSELPQLRGTAALAWRTPEGQRGLLGVTDALSLRGVLLAQRFFERAAQGVGSEGAGAWVETLAVRRGELFTGADKGLGAAEAELTHSHLRAAARALPPTLGKETCRALGCEFLPRCHPG
jgi:hypothetical protein